MNTLLICDSCNDPFDVQNEEETLQRIPLVLGNCGHTLCNQCIAGLIDSKEKSCVICNQKITEKNIQECRQNQKLINFMLSEDAVPIMMGNFDSIPCPKHNLKIIEYFCKTCSDSVCIKCIYDEHNGHSLIPCADMANSLK